VSGNGSGITVGSSMDSYYGRPIVKEPVWQPEVPVYFLTGGIAGSCSVLHGIGRLTRNDGLAKTALYVGAAADVVSPILLISDLGRPERFLKMLRVFKVTSPMSVGSWLLLFSSGASATAAALELLGVLKPVKWVAELVSFVTGPPLATYTGALVADTSIPVWSEARDELPWLFGASAAATGGAATVLFAPSKSAGPARRAALLGAVAELGLTQYMERKLGFVGEVYHQGEAGRYGRVAKACTAAGAALLLRSRRSRVLASAGSALLLAGGAALRFSVFKAGFQSARDPRYVVATQRERLRERGANVR
jgi:formate-dependent nitrite reductase membrane component NrfD